MSHCEHNGSDERNNNFCKPKFLYIKVDRQRLVKHDLYIRLKVQLNTNQFDEKQCIQILVENLHCLISKDMFFSGYVAFFLHKTFVLYTKSVVL